MLLLIIYSHFCCYQLGNERTRCFEFFRVQIEERDPVSKRKKRGRLAHLDRIVAETGSARVINELFSTCKIETSLFSRNDRWPLASVDRSLHNHWTILDFTVAEPVSPLHHSILHRRIIQLRHSSSDTRTSGTRGRQTFAGGTVSQAVL